MDQPYLVHHPRLHFREVAQTLASRKERLDWDLIATDYCEFGSMLVRQYDVHFSKPIGDVLVVANMDPGYLALAVQSKFEADVHCCIVTR